MIKNRNTILLFGVSAVLISIGTGCSAPTIPDYNTPSSSSRTYTNTDGDNESDISVVIQPGVQVVQIDSGPPITTTQGYTAALSLYEKNGMRFKLTNCSENLKSFDIKPGITFMIDNRDNTSHHIGIGTKKYVLAAYDFALIGIQKTGSFTITCDGKDVAYVEVKK